MSKTELIADPKIELSEEAIREQLDLVVQDPAFRSSKRSIEFLRYVVEQTLKGAADQIKERTIGVEVFGRLPSYDTNVDHVVRTAAIELRKRLAIYYGEERHRSELRITLVPGSYVPRFSLPEHETSLLAEAEGAAELPQIAEVFQPAKGADPNGPSAGGAAGRRLERRTLFWAMLLLVFLSVAGAEVYRHFYAKSVEDVFWRPVLDTPGPVLVAVGDVPNGPPKAPSTADPAESQLPTLQTSTSPNVPFADTVTIAEVVGLLEARGKHVLIRRENSSSFADLREGPVLLIGAFNNEWSLRLTHQLRYTPDLDADQHLIYIRDNKNPGSRSWCWKTDRPSDAHRAAGAPTVQDYALISRIWNSDTGHVVVAVGGLYTYGTEAAGEFLSDPQAMQAIAKAIKPEDVHKNVQIVLGTTVTDDTPGPPRVLAISVE